MPKSKHRKNHSVKKKQRTEQALNNKRRQEKMQRELYDRIYSEMQAGKFDNVESGDLPVSGADTKNLDTTPVDNLTQDNLTQDSLNLEL